MGATQDYPNNMWVCLENMYAHVPSYMVVYHCIFPIKIVMFGQVHVFSEANSMFFFFLGRQDKHPEITLLRAPRSPRTLDIYACSQRLEHIVGGCINESVALACTFAILQNKSDRWRFPQMGIPPNGWLGMEDPIRMDDLGLARLAPFQETSKLIQLECSSWSRGLQCQQPLLCATVVFRVVGNQTFFCGFICMYILNFGKNYLVVIYIYTYIYIFI